MFSSSLLKSPRQFLNQLKSVVWGRLELILHPIWIKTFLWWSASKILFAQPYFFLKFWYFCNSCNSGWSNGWKSEIMRIQFNGKNYISPIFSSACLWKERNHGVALMGTPLTTDTSKIAKRVTNDAKIMSRILGLVEQ